MPKNKIGVLQSFAEFCRVRQEFCTKNLTLVKKMFKKNNKESKI